MRARLVWFLLFLWFFIMIFLFLTARVRADVITLQWDYSAEENPDGFRIYQRVVGEEYDYNTPLLSVAGDQRSVQFDLAGEPDAAIKYEFVAKAFLKDEQSDDSNPVEYTVVRVAPPVPIDLIGEFDRENSVIKIAWSQPTDEYDVDHWRVYFRMTGSEDEYSEIGIVRKDNPLEITATFNAVSIGERANIDFVVIAYRRNETYSGNSQIITIDVDRRRLGVPQNLRINIEIPVI